MNAPPRGGPEVPARDLMFVTTPKLWPLWPFLPVVRRVHEPEELGVLFDARGYAGKTGFSATVFLTNLFLLPADLMRLLDMPRESFDTPEELLTAGWRVD